LAADARRICRNKKSFVHQGWNFFGRSPFFFKLVHRLIKGRGASEVKADMRRRNLSRIGAAFLCADLGITPETRDDHAAYFAAWLKVLKDDKRAIFIAASHAQKAADYLHGLQPQTGTTSAEQKQGGRISIDRGRATRRSPSSRQGGPRLFVVAAT